MTNFLLYQEGCHSTLLKLNIEYRTNENTYLSTDCTLFLKHWKTEKWISCNVPRIDRGMRERRNEEMGNLWIGESGSCGDRKSRNWGFGELGNWRIGESGNWGIRERGNEQLGKQAKCGKWGIDHLVNRIFREWRIREWGTGIEKSEKEKQETGTGNREYRTWNRKWERGYRGTGNWRMRNRSIGKQGIRGNEESDNWGIVEGGRQRMGKHINGETHK